MTRPAKHVARSTVKWNPTTFGTKMIYTGGLAIQVVLNVKGTTEGGHNREVVAYTGGH